MSMADRFTQAREAALRAAKKHAPGEAALRPDDTHDELTGEFAPDSVAAPITVLTADTELYEAVRRAVLERHEVSMAANLEQAAELAAAGKCALLITDQALTIEALSPLSERLRRHEPAMVSIAVGNRGQDGMLLGLMTGGAVDRFLLKPLTPALARIVIESAGKEHQSRKPRRRDAQPTDAVPAFTMRRAAKPARREDKNAITQPVRVLPSAPQSEPRADEPASVASTPQVAAREHTPDELPEDQTVVVPALNASSFAAPSVDALHEREYLDTPSSDTQTVLAREHLAVEMPSRLPDTATSAFQPGLPRPPWIVLIAAVVAVGALVWWVMSQRLPDIDPRQVIGLNLSAARAALEAERYLDPADQSAFHHFSAVLALDPANAEAKAGVERIATHFLQQAQALIGEGRFAEAVGALQNVRRVRPDHEGVAALEADLREKLVQQYPQVRKPRVAEPREEVAATPPRTARVPEAVRPASAPVAKVTAPPATTPERSVRAPAPQETRGLDARVITDARQAIEREDFDVARTLIDAAAEMGAAPQDVVALNESLAAAEQNVAKAPPPPVVAVAESTPRTAPTPPIPAVTAPALPEQPVLVRMIQPRYPDEARLRGIEGWVDLSFVVSAAGDVVDPRVEDSSMKHLFARPALAAVRQWKYRPRAAGDPSQRTLARVQFRLAD